MADEVPPGVLEGQKLAMNGKWQQAEQQFRSLVTKGVPHGSVALAQILAFQGKWDEVIENCKIFFENPEISWNYWPFQEAMRQLLVRAAKVTGNISRVAAIIEMAKPVARAALRSEPWIMKSFHRGLEQMQVSLKLKEKLEPNPDFPEPQPAGPELSLQEKIEKYEKDMENTLNDPDLNKDKNHVTKMR